VQRYGSREAAGRALQEAVDLAFRAGELAANSRGIFETTLDVGGSQVTARGVIYRDEIRVGSAWILREP
jgi:hypothetical protein